MAQVFVCNEHRDEGRRCPHRPPGPDRGRRLPACRRLYAYRNHCLHQGGPACEGIVRGKVVDIYGPDKTFLGQTYDDDEPHIVCPWHGWEYKLQDRRMRARSEAAAAEATRWSSAKEAVYVVI